MLKKNNLFLLIAGLLIINTAGFFLKYFEYDTFFILLGFRFHFSIVILFLFLLPVISYNSVKKFFTHPVKYRFSLFLFTALLPLLLIPIDYFILDYFKFSDKNYFFELGLSSIIDYPIYLAWNAPQLFMFFILLNESVKINFPKAFLITLTLFLFEIIPIEILEGIESVEINYLMIIEYSLAVLLVSLLVSKIKNIYIFTLLSFTILWAAVLFLGGDSMAVKILLAGRYETWHGLINPGKLFEYPEYLKPFYLFVMIVLATLFIRKKENE